MRKSLWLISMLVAGAVYAAPARTDVWAEFTYAGTEPAPSGAVHTFKMRLSENFPLDRAMMIIAVDVFGGGECTPVREFGDTFHLKYSVTRVKQVQGPIGWLVRRRRPNTDLVAEMVFGDASGHEKTLRYRSRDDEFPKLSFMERLVVYPGDVNPICTLTWHRPEEEGFDLSTERRSSPWEKTPRPNSGFFIRLIVSDDVLAKIPKGKSYQPPPAP